MAVLLDTTPVAGCGFAIERQSYRTEANQAGDDQARTLRPIWPAEAVDDAEFDRGDQCSRIMREFNIKRLAERLMGRCRVALR